MSSRKGLHFFILCGRPISIRLRSDRVKRPSPAPRLQSQQQKSSSIAYKLLLAFDAAEGSEKRHWVPNAASGFWKRDSGEIDHGLFSPVILPV